MNLLFLGGRLRLQRDLAYEMLNAIPGISCVKPEGAMYIFAKMDQNKFHIKDDEKMVLDLLKQEKNSYRSGFGF